MLSIKKLLLVLLIILPCALVISQDNHNLSDAQIAMQYYRNGEYQKAAAAYKNLYYINRSHTFYNYYLNSLIKSENLAQAETLVKEQIKYNSQNINYIVDLGYVYQLMGNAQKSKNSYNSAIKKLNTGQHQVISLANTFMAKQLFSYAELTYNEGKKMLRGQYGFQMELAQLYYYQRNYDRMIDQYLLLLAESSQYLQSVQIQLKNAVYNDVDNSLKEKLKTALVNKINQMPDVLVFNELLIWLYIQDKQFELAFMQARALDLRLAENGARIVEIARLAQNNNDFDVAIKAYNYVIEKGRHLEFFFTARNELLNVLFKRVELGIDTRNDDFLRLEESYITALDEEGINPGTVDMVKNLAHLQAFYTGKITQAIFLLEDAVNMRGITPMQKGTLELELADIYLVKGSVWDATLAYARVEEYNKNNPVGSDAKFRKARLAYYIGNFDWAMAQLDVLKASTSKLIANDAANLSLFIYDNTGWDTVETALETYTRADFANYRANDTLALMVLDTLINNFTGNELIDDAYYLKAAIFTKQKNYQQAVDCYLHIATNYAYSVLADKSVFALGNLYQNHINDTNKAMEYYKQILTGFPASVYAVEARYRYRALRGDTLVN